MLIQNKKPKLKINFQYIGLFIIGLFFFYLPNIASASWMDAKWLYRAAVPITAHTAAETNVYTTITIDTATPITAGKMQSDCGDIRIAKESGATLPYFINASPGCNNAATTIQVNFSSFPAGAQTIYYYYGNAATYNGFKNAGFATAASAETIGTVGSETQGTGPVGYWKFDDGQGTTAQDSSSSNNDGTITSATWQKEDLCVSGKCLRFDGTDDNVNAGSSSNFNFGTGNFTAEAWVRDSTVDNSANPIIMSKWQDDNNRWYVSLNLQNKVYLYIKVGGVETVAITSNSTSLTNGGWHHVSVVVNKGTGSYIYVDGKLDNSGSAPSGSYDNTGDLRIGSSLTTNYFPGFIDDPKIYPYARTAAQIRADYNAGKNNATAHSGSSVVMGAKTQDYLSNGLVGYWKMDEASGNAVNSSGNSLTLTLTNNSTMAYGAGKFGNAATGDGTADYLNTATTISSVQTIAFWVNPANSTDNYINLTGSTIYINSSSGTVSATGVTSPSVYVNGVLNGTVTASAWNHIVITTASAISASQFEVGRANSAYAVSGSKLDEVRLYNRALSPKEVSDLYNWTPGPVAYWNMEEGTGTSVKDTSGSGLNGTLTGALWQPGKFGKGLYFDGSDDTVNVTEGGGVYDLSTTDVRTFSAWVKYTGPTTNHNVFFGKAGTFAADTGFTLAIWLNRMYMTGDNGVERIDYGGTTTLSPNTWYYLTYVISKPDNTAKFYINGVLDVTKDISNRALSWNNAYTAYLGSRNNSGYYFKGWLDDFKVYNYARTQKQIVSDMNGGNPSAGSGPRSGAIAHYRFDEGQGTTANDNTPNANSLTLSSASWTDSGKFGKAWNGTGALWASRADDADFDFLATDDESISLWFKSDSAANPSATEYLFSKGPIKASSAGYAIYANTDGTLCFGVDDDTTWGPDDSACTTSDIYDATWHHIVAEKTGTAEIRLYVDGVSKATDTSIAATATLANSQILYIGDSNGADGGDEFNGDIDEVKVYRYTLTADEVKTDYNKGAAMVLSIAGNSSSSAAGAANQEYCVPGDTTSCVAPVVRWDFEEKKGTTTNDVSGNANTGTLGGDGAGTDIPTWKAGKVGGALSFDGSDDYINVGNPASLQITGSMTISAWIKTGATSGAIFTKYDTSGGLTSAPYALSLSSGNFRSFVEYDSDCSGTGNQYGMRTGSVNVADNKWHFVSMVYNSSAQTLTHYVDGVIDAGTFEGTVPSSMVNCTDEVEIGSYHSNSDSQRFGFFNGQIDQVRVFNYARSAAQVAYDYNRGGPVGWWKFDECQGGTAHDSSGNNNSGTITIGATDEATLGTCTTSSTAWGTGATGKRNASLSFDGTDDYISGTMTNPFVNTQAGTFAAWVYPTSYPASADENDIFSFGAPTNHRLTVLEGATDRAWFIIYNTAGANSNVASTINIPLNQWTHIAATFDSTGLKMYVNGKLDGTAAALDGAIKNEATPTYRIGTGTAGTNYFWAGQIDDTRIYNYALTATQVKDIMNNGAINFAPSTGTP